MSRFKSFNRKAIALLIAIISVVSVLPIQTALATEVFSTEYCGRGEIAYKQYTVYSSNTFTNAIGTIYYNEGYTILSEDAPCGWAWVEYSTPNGAKRGYIQIPHDDNVSYMAAVARVETYTTVYYGRTDLSPTFGSYQTAGSVSAGEFVAILAKDDNWAYIEYNTKAGRKRGYVPYTNLTIFNRPSLYHDLYIGHYDGEVQYKSGKLYVYSGPTTLYTQVGWIENENVIKYNSGTVNGHYYEYIEYSSGGKTKSGYLVFN